MLIIPGGAYTADRGQAGILNSLEQHSIPALNGYEYSTHAVYAAGQPARTLVFGYGGPLEKYEAKCTVSHEPGARLEVVADLCGQLASRVLIGAEPGRLFTVPESIAAVAIQAEYDASSITFFNRSKDLVEVLGLTDQDIFNAVISFSAATFNKLNRISYKLPIS